MRRRSTIGWWVAALVALGLGAYVLFLRRQPPLTSPAQETVPPAQVPGAPEAPASPEPLPTPGGSEPEGVPTTTLPPLAESDAPVRELARGLSPNPALSRWLSGEGLIPRFIAVVDNVAEGVSPRPHLLFLAPEASFQIVTRDGRQYIDPRSYGRYDAAADVITSLDPRAAVGLYRQLQPLCEEAYRELGHPPGRFDDVLAKAIQTLLATPVVDGEIELRPKVVTYAFADPRLEALSPAQKHFLRMGPRNVRLIQGELRTLA
ncbi:MAG TPA: DUF3014 domain-containing protein, partial [Methylomirabilota bacterium]